MDIEGLTDFITLAGCRSFSKAASLRHVTQPAFSRRIKALEAKVGVELIDRDSKSFKLTMAGERFLVHANNIVNVADKAVSDTQSLVTRMHDPIYVAAPAYLTKTFFPRWYKQMQKAIPGLTMRISYQRGSNALADIRKGTADFALVMSAQKVDPCYNYDDLELIKLGADRMLAVASRQLKSPDKLLMYEQGSYMNSCAEAVLGKLIKNDVVFESSSTGLQKEMALAGFGIAVLPESVVEDDVRSGYLVPVKGAKSLDCDILLIRAKNGAHKKADKLWSANKG